MIVLTPLVVHEAAVCALTLLLLQTARSWPGVTVILPVKGRRRHSIANWRSHVNLKYPGSIEFLFVVDSQVSDLSIVACALQANCQCTCLADC